MTFLHEHYFFCFFIYIFLQAYNISFSGFYNILATICAFCVFVSYVVNYVMAFLSINKIKDEKTKEEIYLFYGGLISDIKHKEQEEGLHPDFWMRNYHLVNYIKKLLLAVIIVFFFKYPKFQAISITFLLTV